MNRHVVSVVVVLALMVTLTAFGQDEERAGQTEQRQDIRQRWQNMSEEEREKFRAEMRERRQKWESMSEEEREKFRAQMGERFSARRQSMGPEEQLKAIRIIEEQVAKLKAAVEGSMGPETRSQLRELPEEERAKLREKMIAAMKERQMAIMAIEQQIERLRGPGRQVPEYRPRISELKAIHELAVKENATKTAKRLEELIAVYQRESQGRVRPPESEPREEAPRQRRERPVRREGDEAADAGKKAREFKLLTFDGKTISLSEYRGKIVVLEWLNFECPFVQYHYDKANTMIDLAKKYRDKNVVWLAINSTSHTTQEANIEFAKKHKLPYLILDDRSGDVGHAYGAKTTPHMYIIDRRGNLVYEGAIDNSPNGRTPSGQELTNYVDKALEELLAGKAVSTPNTRPYGCTVKYPK